MHEDEKDADFSLLGGPLYRMACWLGLIRDGRGLIRLGLALGGTLWIVMLGLNLLDGTSSQMFSLAVIGGHVRLLVAIP